MDRIHQLKLVHSISVNREACNEKTDLPITSLITEKCDYDAARVLEQRRGSRRERKIEAAMQHSQFLTFNVQKNLLGILLEEGWGRLPHGIARQLKCPKRFGLKLVEIALIMTVYDATVAAVKPRVFAPVTVEEFENETCIDRRDIGRALSTLLQRGILLKLKEGGMTFWGLNPHYFILKEKTDQSFGKLPLGEIPMGDSPCTKRGKTPMAKTGDFPQGDSSINVDNKKENAAPKNLIQESLKESLLSGNEFPNEMLARWSEMSSHGFESKAKKEREIFEVLFPIHGKPFFENCAKVIAFLENHGVVKNGVVQKIHSPMIWIRDHWQHNLEQYEKWRVEEKAREQAKLNEINHKAKALAEEDGKRRIKACAEREEAAFKEKCEDAAQRFMNQYRDEKSMHSFIAEALRLKDNRVISEYYKKYGWNNPIVRFTVLEHFLKVESGECLARVESFKEGGAI